jgi:hypothetical protein
LRFIYNFMCWTYTFNWSLLSLIDWSWLSSSVIRVSDSNTWFWFSVPATRRIFIYSLSLLFSLLDSISKWLWSGYLAPSCKFLNFVFSLLFSSSIFEN